MPSNWFPLRKRTPLALAALACLPLALASSVQAQHAGSANPSSGPNPPPAPPAPPAAPAPHGTVPGPAVQAGDTPPSMAEYYRQAAQLYRNAAAQCPPRAACYGAFADYHACLAAGLGGGGACAKPACSITSPPCQAAGGPQPGGPGAPQSSPATAAQQGFANIASTILSIEAERSQREADRMERLRLQQMRADQVIDKWRLLDAELRSMYADPDVKANRFLVSPENHTCPGEAENLCVVPNGAGDMLSRLENPKRDYVGNMHQGIAVDEEPQLARGTALVLDAFHRYKERVLFEEAERKVRLALAAAQTTGPAVVATRIAQGIPGVSVLRLGGAPVWTKASAPGSTEIFPLEGGKPRKLTLNRNFAWLFGDGQNLFFNDGRAIFRTALAGGEAVLLATAPADVQWLDVDATDVYFSVSVPKTTVWRVAKSGGAPVEVLSFDTAPTGIALGANALYWAATEQAGRVVGRVYARPKNGGPAVIVADNRFTCWSLAEFDGALYWTDDGDPINGPGHNGIWSGTATAGSGHVVVPDLESTLQVQAAGGFVYFSASEGDQPENTFTTITRVSLADGHREVLVDRQPGALVFVAAPGALYYATGGGQVTPDGQFHHTPDGTVWKLALPPAKGAPTPAAAASTAAVPSSAGCTKDTDCKGDRVCNAGACEEPKRHRRSR